MVRGIIAGNFDVIHPGYMYMFRDSTKYCDHLTVALQEDPTIERPEKCKPVLSFDERKEILLGIKYIDDVLRYNTEEELKNILKTNKFSVRILGEDYIKKYATGQEYSEKIVYINRSHNWSTTKFKKAICMSLHGE
jgi:glycerol-3-phosphate cytidylyltransferase